MYARRKILVLGGTSYFGKYLVEMLLKNGDEVTIATRGREAIPQECSHIPFHRGNGVVFPSQVFWGVIFDQSCYHIMYLNGMERTIQSCQKYIMTSTQAVYPAGININEEAVDYNEIEKYAALISPYGLEKLKSEKIVAALNANAIFPRFPTVVGSEDPRRRLQSIIDKIISGKVELPLSNPSFQLIDAHDAASALFQLSLCNHVGPINLAANSSLTAKELCDNLSNIINRPASYHFVEDYQYDQFDLIKSQSKTLNLKRQNLLHVSPHDVNATIFQVCSHYNNVVRGKF